jgi:hypothetical protein
MGVDYVQGRTCRVKRELGVDVLVSRLKARGQAALLMKRLAANGEDPMTAKITRVVQYPNGPVAEEVTVGELLKTGQSLDPFRPLCEGCTANFRQADFGCCGFLNYPIARAEEEWLLSRLPADIRSPAGIFLRSVLEQLKIDGARVAAIRGRGGLYFEAQVPPTRRWPDADGEVVVSADQLIQFLFYSGGITPSHGALTCLFLGLLPHDIAPEAMRAILNRPATLQDHLTFDPAALSMLQETQMGMFLMGVMSAAINLEVLTIDA